MWQVLAPILGKVLDRVLPDKAAREAANLEVLKLAASAEGAQLAAEVQLAAGQMDINKIEAANPNIFVSGWRPAIGWICGAGLASQYVIGPLFEWSSGLLGERIMWPIANNAELATLLLGMLGLGAMRTTEKIKGAA